MALFTKKKGHFLKQRALVRHNCKGACTPVPPGSDIAEFSKKRSDKEFKSLIVCYVGFSTFVSKAIIQNMNSFRNSCY